MRTRLAALAVMLAVAAGTAGSHVPATVARFVDAALVTGLATTDTLAPPTNLAASGGASAVLTWTPTTSAFAAGYHVERSTTPIGPWVLAATVTPQTAAGYTDSPGPGLFHYRANAYFSNWTSVPTSVVTALVTGSGWKSCASNAPASGGDGDGFEVSPDSACLEGPPAAADVNSGTNNNNSCTNAGKDKHRFWDFSLGLPTVVTAISGIEVRLDHAVSNTSGVNRMCVRLSWNGGTSWTSTQQVNLTSTTITTDILGGPADTWGRTWTGAQLSNANFRVEVIDVANQSGKDFTLEYIAVNVTYTP